VVLGGVAVRAPSAVRFEVELLGRTYDFEARVTPGSWGTHLDPPDPPEVEVVSVHLGDVEVPWEDLEREIAAGGQKAEDEAWQKITERADVAESDARWEAMEGRR